MSLPRISIVRRTEDIPKWLPLVTTLGAVVLAFLIGAIILASIGANPLYIYSYFFRGSFGSLGSFSDVMVKASPLILIGLGCSLAFKMKLWNIGAEGQFFMGAFMASLVPLVHWFLAIPPKIHRFVDDGFAGHDWRRLWLHPWFESQVQYQQLCA